MGGRPLPHLDHLVTTQPVLVCCVCVGGRCPLRGPECLTAASVLLHRRLTGAPLANVSAAARDCCGHAAQPVGRAWHLSEFVPALSESDHLRGLLLRACRDADAATARALLAAGAPVDGTGAYGLTGLHEAACAAAADVVEALLVRPGAAAGSVNKGDDDLLLMMTMIAQGDGSLPK
jgi:hypothetical protein